MSKKVFVIYLQHDEPLSEPLVVTTTRALALEWMYDHTGEYKSGLGFKELPVTSTARPRKTKL